MPHKRAKTFTRHDDKSIRQFAPTRFPSEQRVVTFFLEIAMSTPCDTTL